MKSVYTGGEKVAEFESYDELRVGDGKPALIYEGNELVYPSPVKDGLVLWYDLSGMTNNDTNRGIATDLSGNGNDGTLQNFNYTEESGYIGNSLQFDGVDDTINALNPLFYQTSETQAWSVELVLKTQHLNSGTIVNKLVWGINTGLDLRNLGNDSQVTFLNFIANSPLSYLYATKRKVDLNEIVHVVFSYDNKTKENSIVINSKSKESLIIDVEQHPPTGMAEEIYLSHNKKKNTFYSTRIYNRPLTEQEIAHNYAIEKERFNIQEV